MTKVMQKKTFAAFMGFQITVKVFPTNFIGFAVKMALLAYFCKKETCGQKLLDLCCSISQEVGMK